MPKRYRKYLVIGCLIALVSALMLPKEQVVSTTPRDMADILSEGILRVTTEYGKHAYYVGADGTIGGFHYQLIRQFAEEHGLQLEVIPEMSLPVQDSLLLGGHCDLIAGGRLLVSGTDSLLAYTTPITIDRQVIIQRHKEADDSLCSYVESQLQLAGKTVCIPENSPVKQRIHHFIEEIGDSIFVEEIPRYGTEQLMALVAHGDRCYAICEEHMVQAHIHRYPQLDTRLAFSFTQFYSWAVNPQSTVLLDSLNCWLRRKGFNYRKEDAVVRQNKKHSEEL